MLNNNLILLKENKKKMDTVSRVQRAEMRGSCLTYYKRHTFSPIVSATPKILSATPEFEFPRLVE